MLRVHAVTQVAKHQLQNELGAESEATTDGASGFDSDGVGACSSSDLETGNAETHTAIRHSCSTRRPSNLNGALEPMRLPVTETSLPTFFASDEPARLFGFDHLAPVSHQPSCARARQPFTVPQTYSDTDTVPTCASFATIDSPPVSPSLHLMFAASSGGILNTMCIQWTVDARKLYSKDNVIVSSSFNVPLATSTPFKIMLLPKQTYKRKGGPSFLKSCGVGKVQLKCDAIMPRETGFLKLRLQVGKQASSHEQLHDFSQYGVCGLAKGWNFRDAVDRTSWMFVVRLEMIGVHAAAP
eukprot:TRINITY_DN44424_c0_g1_i1.p1 TRINITY_DN44424_c0_g1~~TRINITY_DN44424_c0_g1_i1.p1  ORF type:complete len:313 (+),score=42.93 TRINITY_DN44424_c0_g1_i1:47-940(+)